MDDTTAVRIECNAVDDGEITDGCARTIAAWFASPGNSEEAQRFFMTGEISTPADDVWRGMVGPGEYFTHDADTRRALDCLGTYLLNREDRGPVPGWSRMWVR